MTILTTCPRLFSSHCHHYISLYDLWQVRFYQICNGVIQYLADSSGNTDESHCSLKEWSCEIYHSKCDRLWNCLDGRDEVGCSSVTRSSLYCNNTAHFCLDYSTGEPVCLPTVRAGDGVIDCVGSWDEREFCRKKYPLEVNRRYHCQNSSICINIDSICDCQQDCPENDDETSACRWVYPEQKCNSLLQWINRCQIVQEPNYDGRSDLFCDLLDVRNTYIWNVHQRRKLVSKPKVKRVKREPDVPVDYQTIWSCNRGLYAR